MVNDKPLLSAINLFIIGLYLSKPGELQCTLDDGGEVLASNVMYARYPGL